MPGFAELRLETHCFHKGLVVLLPDRMALEVPVQYNTFHIVRQDILGDTHVAKGMDHANEQILLFGIGEELNIPLTAVVADHSEAGCGIFCSVIVQYLTAFRDVDMVACYYPAGNSTYEPETKERYGADVMIWLGKGADGSYSGTCNSGKVKWVLKNGTLTISGNGHASGWIEKQQPYWYPQRNAIKKVVFSGNIQSVGSRAFMNCVNLTDIQWVNSITFSRGSVFAGCTSLTAVALPDNITTLSGSVFSGCTNLQKVDLPASLNVMYEYTFYNCSNLTSVTIPYGVTDVLKNQFTGCNNLTSIYFRGNLPKNLSDGAFDGFAGTVYYTPGNKTWTQKITELEGRYPGVTFAPKGAPAQSNPGTPSTSPDTPTTNPDITPETTSPHTTVPAETTIPVPTETTVPETVETTVPAVSQTQPDTTGTTAADITTTVPSPEEPDKKGNNGALIVAMLAAGTLSLGTVIWQLWRKRR